MRHKILTLFRMGIFWGTHGWGVGGGGGGKVPLLKICHTYPTMINQSYIKKYINHVIHALIFADVSIFSPRISKFCYIKKYRYRFHFDT